MRFKKRVLKEKEEDHKDMINKLLSKMMSLKNQKFIVNFVRKFVIQKQNNVKSVNNYIVNHVLRKFYIYIIKQF